MSVHRGIDATRDENNASHGPSLTNKSFGFDVAFFGRHMRRLGRAESTIEFYSANIRRLFEHLKKHDGHLTNPERVRSEQVEWFIDHLIASHGPTAASHHLPAIRSFFAILESQGGIKRSPVGEIRAPGNRPEPAAVLTTGELRSLLWACRGRRFNDLRDMAMARVFVSTGARRSEVLGLSIDPLDYREGDIDFKAGTVLISGVKGGGTRTCSIDRATVLSLRRYLRSRRVHRYNHLPDLWLGLKGGLKGSGLYRTFKSRAELAGIRGFHLHRIRHTFAHEWLLAGGNEGDLMNVLGWRSREMVDYYSSSVAEERAVAAARKHAMSLGL